MNHTLGYFLWARALCFISTELSKCKKGVSIINVACGGIVNERDLVDAMSMGQVGGAASEVPKSCAAPQGYLYSSFVGVDH